MCRASTASEIMLSSAAQRLATGSGQSSFYPRKWSSSPLTSSGGNPGISTEELQRRLESAERELRYADLCDFRVVNAEGRADEAGQQVKAFHTGSWEKLS
jgi:hypothetical protein